METQGKFSPERLFKIRRLRKARRYFKQTPLFAYERMAEEYPGYGYAEFVDDLRRRSKPKKRQPKTTLKRYGRYWRMLKYLRLYEETRDITYAVKAAQLRQLMTKPYRVVLLLKGEQWEYRFPATTPIERMEELVTSARKCKTATEIEQLIDTFKP